jgi:hypothetical protein
MIMDWNRNRIRIGRRDRFWLTVSLVVIAILFVLRILSHDGFSDSGRMVWKSAVLGSEPMKDTSRSKEVHAAVRQSSH